MRLTSILLFAYLTQVFCAPDEADQPTEDASEVAETDSEEQHEDQAPVRPEPGSPPPGEGAEYDMSPFESLIKRCDGWEFPEEAFEAQPEKEKVYLKVAKTADSPFAEQNLTKFTSVFGIRIIADEDVDDKKIEHVANTLAKVLDADGDGKPDNENLITELLTFHPILFVISNGEKIMSLMNAQEPDQGFPMELKFCPFAFDFEEAGKIVPGGSRGDATCEVDEGAVNKNDRTLAFVLDHLMGRGFGQVLSTEQQERLDKIYKDSLDAGTFEPENTGCPQGSDDCGRVMLASWGLSTLLGFDTCWCENAHALKFCDPESLKKGETELVDLLGELFPDATKADDKPYAPKNKSVIAN